VGVGANHVLLYDSAWNHLVKRGEKGSQQQFFAAYFTVGAPILFTTCAASLSLFSKLISPVIVISQVSLQLCINWIAKQSPHSTQQHAEVVSGILAVHVV
jgi:hypothetical protein